MAVVDEDLVAGFEHRAQDVRRDGKVVATALVLTRDHDRVAHFELGRPFEVSDADLGALQVGNQREGPACLGLHGSGSLRADAVLVLLPVGEVEADSVHSGIDEGGQARLVVRGRADRRDDLGSACGRHHRSRL